MLHEELTAMMRFHHVGYAVSSIEDYLSGFMAPLFSPSQVTDPVLDPVQQVRVCFVEMQGGAIWGNQPRRKHDRQSQGRALSPVLRGI